MAGKDDRLRHFIGQSIAAGITRDEISAVLSKAEWAPEQIQKGIAEFAEVKFPVPVPKPKKYVSARDAFLYLLIFTALYVSVYALGSLLFDLVNLAIPDPATTGYRSTAQYYERGIRSGISMLVTFFPAYVLLTIRTDRAVQRDPTKRGSKIRKWLTYLTLFASAMFILGDLSSLIYQFLMGSISTRILLKILVVGIIAGAVFGYYLWEMHRDEHEIKSG